MATDAKTLLQQAACYDCFGSGQGVKDLMKLALLQQILLALNPMAATDPESLLAQANCYSCYGNSSQWQLMELALLAQISANGGSAPAAPSFESGLLPMNAVSYQVAHGLGAVPKEVRMVMVAVGFDANLKYPVGYELATLVTGSIGDYGADATNCSGWVFGVPLGNEASWSIYVFESNATASPVSFNNFRFKFYANL